MNLEWKMLHQLPALHKLETQRDNDITNLNSSFFISTVINSELFSTWKWIPKIKQNSTVKRSLLIWKKGSFNNCVATVTFNLSKSPFPYPLIDDNFYVIGLLYRHKIKHNICFKSWKSANTFQIWIWRWGNAYSILKK